MDPNPSLEKMRTWAIGDYKNVYIYTITKDVSMYVLAIT